MNRWKWFWWATAVIRTGPLDAADWLQTGAAINPGNGGGPWINLRGERTGTKGLLIAEVERGSPAAAAGLQDGMVIVSIDRQPVADLVAAGKILCGKKRGDPVKLGLRIERALGNFAQKQTGIVVLKVR